LLAFFCDFHLFTPTKQSITRRHSYSYSGVISSLTTNYRTYLFYLPSSYFLLVATALYSSLAV
jgi:hypothetical protein